MPAYLSGVCCAQVSNQSLQNNLAKESNIIIQYDGLNHIFANANTVTHKWEAAPIGSCLIFVDGMGSQRGQGVQM